MPPYSARSSSANTFSASSVSAGFTLFEFRRECRSGIARADFGPKRAKASMISFVPGPSGLFASDANKAVTTLLSSEVSRAIRPSDLAARFLSPQGSRLSVALFNSSINAGMAAVAAGPKAPISQAAFEHNPIIGSQCGHQNHHGLRERSVFRSDLSEGQGEFHSVPGPLVGQAL